MRGTDEVRGELALARFQQAPPETGGIREERKMRLWKATLPTLLLPLALGANAHEGQQHPAASAKKEQMPWGIAGDARASVKTIVLSMTDMRFTPNRVEVE